MFSFYQIFNNLCLLDSTEMVIEKNIKHKNQKVSSKPKISNTKKTVLDI